MFEISRGKDFINYLTNYLSTTNFTLNVRNLMGLVFDRETCRYMDEIMLVNEKYRGDNYVFDYVPSVYREVLNKIEDYLDLCKSWGKPVLLLFGSNDGVTKKSFKQFGHNQVDENIVFMHIQDASHVTPCMDSMFQISKFTPVVSFFKQGFESICEEEELNISKNCPSKTFACII